MPSSTSATQKKHNLRKLLTSTTNKLVTEAVQNREIFRDMAAKAYEAFDDEDRKLCKQLQTTNVTMQHVLQIWKERVLPIRDDLEKKRTDPAFARFIIHNLYLSKESAQAKINRLVDESEDEFLDATIKDLYGTSGDVPAEKRQAAKAFFEQNQQALEMFYQHFISFTAYMQAARTAHVTIYDSMSSWIERQRALKTIKKERQHVLRQQKQRLQKIAEEKAELRTEQNGLLGELLDHRWQTSDMQELFDHYQAEVSALPKGERLKPAKHLAVFEAVTASFREQEVHRRSEQSSPLALSEARSLSEAVDALLLRFFDLTSAQKKHLLRQANVYAALEHEEAEINELLAAYAKHFSV